MTNADAWFVACGSLATSTVFALALALGHIVRTAQKEDLK